MKCNICGHEVSANSRFCETCGAETVRQTTGRTCPNCESIVAEGILFCNVCGASVNNSPETYKPSGPDLVSVEESIKDFEVRNGILKVIIAALLIGLIVACGFIGFFVFREYLAEDTNDGNNINYQDDDIVISDEAMEPDEDDSAEQESSVVKAPFFEYVNSTSSLEATDKYSYYAMCACDGDTSTSWQEGVPGVGIGESITFTSDTKQTVTSISVLNGYTKSEDIYYKNNRVKELIIRFSEGETYRVSLDDYYGEYNKITFDKPIECYSVTLEISSVYKGSKYDDTGISEINFR